MQLFRSFLSVLTLCLLLGTVAGLSGCDSEEDPDYGPITRIYQETILVSVDGAPEYILGETEVTQALYNGPLATLEVTGKLSNGKQLLLSFQQSAPTIGANKTDMVEADLAGIGKPVSATATTIRNATSNTASGSFKLTFATGLVVEGKLKEVQLQ